MLHSDEQNLEILPILNKMDLPQAEPQRVINEIEEIIGIPAQRLSLSAQKMALALKNSLNVSSQRFRPPLGIQCTLTSTHY